MSEFLGRRIIAAGSTVMLGFLAAGCSQTTTGDKRSSIVQGLINDGYDENDFFIGEITRNPGGHYHASMGVVGCTAIDAEISALDSDKWTVIDDNFQPETPDDFLQWHGCR